MVGQLCAQLPREYNCFELMRAREIGTYENGQREREIAGGEQRY